MSTQELRLGSLPMTRTHWFSVWVLTLWIGKTNYSPLMDYIGKNDVASFPGFSNATATSQGAMLTPSLRSSQKATTSRAMRIRRARRSVSLTPRPPPVSSSPGTGRPDDRVVISAHRSPSQADREISKTTNAMQCQAKETFLFTWTQGFLPWVTPRASNTSHCQH